MKRKHKTNNNVDDTEKETSGDITKLLDKLQPAKKLLKSILKNDEPKASTESNPESDKESDEDDEAENEEQIESASDVEGEDEEEDQHNMADPFYVHFEQVLSEETVQKFQECSKMEKVQSEVKNDVVKEEFQYKIDNSLLEDHQSSFKSEHATFSGANYKEKLVRNWAFGNKIKKSKENLSKVQREILKPFSLYQDLYFSDRNFENGEEIRRLYALHAVNHILKTRSRILKHNAKLQNAAESGVEIEDLRDQGITRPKVLILVPFKDSCYKIISIMRKLLFEGEKKAQVMQKKRFKLEFYSEEQNYQGFRPDDFKKMFEGNIDDCFRLGVSISKNTMKLFTQFYSSDIIIASPLGLRTVIGGKGEKQDFDFLSSIEILIMDQSDVFLMQNWEHVLTVLDYVNKTPTSTRDTDISRVRMWSVNEWSKYYRQTLLFSSFQSPEINSIFNRYCHNFAGKWKWSVTNVAGSVQQVVNEVPQVFRRIEVPNHASLPDKRFDYFINHILPDLKKNPSSVAIFIPSYFDFVRVRNYMKKEEINFVQISEYTKKSYSSHARTLFKDCRKQFLLFTGRFFFYYRYRIRGIKYLLFYDVPLYSNFYSDIINFMERKDESPLSCATLFSKYDAHKLEGIVGTERMKKMMTGKAVHMIVTGQ